MAKRKPLSFDNDQLTHDLKKSVGQGVDVFFSPVSTTPPSKKPDNLPISNSSVKQKSSVERPLKTVAKKKEKTGNNKLQTSNIASKQASNIAILQFNDTDIEHLRQAAYKAQTYRFADREVEWIKDTAHSLSKEMQRGKVSQVDILRMAIKLFENVLATSKTDLLKIFERMK